MDDALLVIGFGNSLRSDDGVGPRVADAVERLRLPGVRTIARIQLTPELADPISRARAVVFVDAAVDQAEPTLMRRLDPFEDSRILEHSADPRFLLALARDAFGTVPEAWLLTVGAEDLGFGERLSPAARRGLRAAVREVLSLHRDLDGRGRLQPPFVAAAARMVRPLIQVRA